MLNRTKFSKLIKRRQNHGSWQKEKRHEEKENDDEEETYEKRYEKRGYGK